MCEIGIQAKVSDSLRILWVCFFGQKWSNFHIWVKKKKLLFQIIQNGLLKTFYQFKIGIHSKFSNLLRILSVCFFSQKLKQICHAGMVNFSDLGSKTGQFRVTLWFQIIQNMDYWRHFISADWVYNQKFQIYWEFGEFGFLVQNKNKSAMLARSNFQIWGKQNWWFYGSKR